MPAMDNAVGSTVPAFLTKLLALVEDPKTDDLIRWSPTGSTFIVGDHGRFSKEVLPRYFKHNNIASFIRQLNMYGFRKMVGIDAGGLKSEKDETEFFHPNFVRGQPDQLELIRRKVSSSKGDEVKVKHGDVTRVLTEVKQMKGKQENLDSRLDGMKRENEALWREVAELRQKHAKQQTIVNRLIQFLLSLVQTSRTGLKRRMPLMLNDRTEAPTPKSTKFERYLSIEPTTSNSYDYEIQSSSSSNSPTNQTSSGPVISDVTDILGTESQTVGGAENLNIGGEGDADGLDEPTAEQETPGGGNGGLDSDATGHVALQAILQRLEGSNSMAARLQHELGAMAAAPATDSSGLVNLPEPSVESPLESFMAAEGGGADPSSKAHTHANAEDDSAEATVAAETPELQPSEAKDLKHLQVAVSQIPKIRCDLNEHCDSMQSNLDQLQGLLSGEAYSLDLSSLVELFNPSAADQPSLSSDTLNLLNTLTDDSSGTNIASTSSNTHAAGNIVGNEVTAYSGPAKNILEDFAIPSFYDLTDESTPIFDTEEFDEKSSAKKSTA